MRRQKRISCYLRSEVSSSAIERILVVGVVFIAAPCAFAELKPTRQPISANAAAETNFMLSPLCVSLRRPGEPVGRASPARQPDSNDNRLFLDGKDSRLGLASLGPVGRSATVSRCFHFATVFWLIP